jgi:hypothetical protein
MVRVKTPVVSIKVFAVAENSPVPLGSTCSPSIAVQASLRLVLPTGVKNKAVVVNMTTVGNLPVPCSHAPPWYEARRR